MSRIDTLDSATNALATSIKLLRLLVTGGATIEQLQGPISSRGKRSNLLAYLAAGCPKVNYSPEGNTAVAEKTSTSYDEAQRILGGDFISPEEVMAARSGILYGEDQLKALAASIPSADVLRQLKDNGFALVPHPPHPLPLVSIRKLESGLFYKQDWYSNEAFATQTKAGTGWIAVKKEPINGSTSKTWNEQNRLLKDNEVAPNAAEMCWFVTTFFKVRGVRLFERIYVRCVDLDSDGSRVSVGGFGAEGLGVDSCYWDGFRYDYVGVSSARKF